MRLIDADALLAAMYHEAFENDASYDEKNPLAKWDSGLWVRYKMFERCLESAPSIDAVPVIRCKDCIYNPKKDEHTTQCPCSTTGDPFLDWIPDDNWFCADGEREES